MNYKVDVEHRTEREVAVEFLKKRFSQSTIELWKIMLLFVLNTSINHTGTGNNKRLQSDQRVLTIIEVPVLGRQPY